jgi:hypothetical protein
MTAHRFEQVERSSGIDVEVVEGALRGQVVARLRGGMDDRAGDERLDQSPDALSIANVEFVVREPGAGS